VLVPHRASSSAPYAVERALVAVVAARGGR